MEIKILYVIIPLALFYLSFITTRFLRKKSNFWERLNVGRSLCLESLSMGAIAWLHLTIENGKYKIITDGLKEILENPSQKILDQLDKFVKITMESIKMQPIALEVIGIFILIAFFVLTLIESDMNGFRGGTKIKRKYKKEDKTIFTGHYKFYVLSSLLTGLCSLLMIIFIYRQHSEDFMSSLKLFISGEASLIFLLVGFPLFLIGLFDWFSGNFDRSFKKEKKALPIVTDEDQESEQ